MFYCKSTALDDWRWLMVLKGMLNNVKDQLTFTQYRLLLYRARQEEHSYCQFDYGQLDIAAGIAGGVVARCLPPRACALAARFIAHVQRHGV